MAKKGVKQRTKKKKAAPEKAAVHIHSTFNNTIVTLTDTEGRPIIWSSGGNVGFKGAKKGLHSQLKWPQIKLQKKL